MYLLLNIILKGLQWSKCLISYLIYVVYCIFIACQGNKSLVVVRRAAQYLGKYVIANLFLNSMITMLIEINTHFPHYSFPIITECLTFFVSLGVLMREIYILA